MQNHAAKPGMISFNLKWVKIAKCFFFSTSPAFSLAKVKPYQFVLGGSRVCFVFPNSLS